MHKSEFNKSTAVFLLRLTVHDQYYIYDFNIYLITNLTRSTETPKNLEPTNSDSTKLFEKWL